MAERIAVVTGANRGIGLEVVRQLAARGATVVLGSRDPDRGEAAARPLLEAGLNVEVAALQVTRTEDVDRLAAGLGERYGRVDVLVNNAAIHYDTWQDATNADLGVVREALETNLMGAWQMTLGLLPLLRKGVRARIVNVSSELGSLTHMGGGSPAYKVSKAGLNALTRMLADELRRDGVLVNSICPGWVATDMGGAGGRAVEEGAAGIVWAAELPEGGPTGGFFRDRQAVDW